MAFDQDATLIRMASPRISLYNLGSTQSTTHHTPPSRGGGVNQICPTGSARGRCLGRRCPYLLPGRLGDKSNRKKTSAASGHERGAAALYRRRGHASGKTACLTTTAK